ncbi:MAG: hypothetical protein RIS88_1644 [Pseudomonadota bacterium]|jgi:hypothetical protein
MDVKVFARSLAVLLGTLGAAAIVVMGQPPDIGLLPAVPAWLQALGLT